MGIDSLVKSVLSELQVAINSKTVVGEPIAVQNWTVIPVTKVSFGFGVGGGEGKKESTGFGGGSGGGATIEPMAFIAVNATEVKLISLKGKDTVWEKLLNVETAEKIYNKLMGLGDNGSVGSAAKDPVTTASPADSKPSTDMPKA
ncbi:MAG TPA: spore germination protein GerW family protein [Candidatus Ozemobacteraceae bacterium]|nr:spore germination protein GerW family protein [Candidatus Ozemobacteraceae bacterium]